MDADTENSLALCCAILRIKAMKHYMMPLFATPFVATSLLLSGCSNASSPEQVSNPLQKVAQTAASEVMGVDAVMTGNWDILPEASHIKFTAQQEGAAFTGEFSEFTGVIAFDPDTPEDGYVKISIPLGSVDAGSKDRNSTLPGKVWFSTKAFPTAVFTSDNIARDGDGYLAKGELTLKGQTAAVELPFTLTLEGDRAVMTGDVVIDRTIWNVGSDPWNTDEWVSRGVKLDIQVTANRIP